jgi:hypothetical protein
MCVVKVGCESEEGYYGGEFMEDEEGCNVRERCISKGASVFVKEGRKTTIEALDAGL